MTSEHEHCWHAREHLHTYAVRRDVCCHCGTSRIAVGEVTIPDGHGPYFARDYRGAPLPEIDMGSAR
jgi:hypothetical protein